VSTFGTLNESEHISSALIKLKPFNVQFTDNEYILGFIPTFRSLIELLTDNIKIESMRGTELKNFEYILNIRISNQKSYKIKFFEF
jgi:hypothetical protein